MTTVLGRSAPRPAPFDSPIGLLMATDYDFTLEEVRDAVRDRVSCDDLCKAKNLGSCHFLLDRLVCMFAFRLLLGQRPDNDGAHDCKSLHTIYYSLAENKHAPNTLPSFRCEMSVKSLSSATFIVGVSLLSTSICGYGADKSFGINNTHNAYPPILAKRLGVLKSQQCIPCRLHAEAAQAITPLYYRAFELNVLVDNKHQHNRHKRIHPAVRT